MHDTNGDLVRSNRRWWVPTRARAAALAGATIVSVAAVYATTARRPEAPASYVREEIPAPNTPAPAAPVDPDVELLKLPPDGDFRLALNGRRLLPKSSTIDEEALRETKIRLLPDGGMLLGVDTELRRIGPDGRTAWTYDVSQRLFDFAFVAATDLVYGTAGDNEMFVLDASTGKERYANGRSGSWAYGQVIPYGEDECLITDDLSMYRARDRGTPNETSRIQNEPDSVTAWRGTEELWTRKIPPDAELYVRGDEVVAVTTTRGNVYAKTLRLPPPRRAKIREPR